jgi:iron complex transport system ATP-binding protein
VLEIKNLCVRYGTLDIVKNVSFAVQDGEWLMIAGPNGAGKSTIINAITGGVPYTGQILLNGQDIRKNKPTELAKSVGVLTQNHYVGYSFSVEEVVRLGRYAYSPGVLAKRCDDDEKMVEDALEKTGMAAQRTQSVLTLSGGELQRTFLAQVFAQNPKYLLLDEPTNHLDLIYQRQVFTLIKEWLKQGDRAVISVVHDLSLARKYGTRALLLNRGQTAAIDSADKALSREMLEQVYGMDVYAYMKEMLSQWQ